MRWPLIAAAAVGAAALLGAPQIARAGSCEEQTVVMISTSWCGYCRKARIFFDENNVDFEEIDAEQTSHAGVRELYRRTGVPIIFVGQTMLQGFNEDDLRQALCLPE